MYVADNDEEGGDHQEVWLQEVETTIQDAYVTTLDPLSQHLRNVAMRHVELALCPTFALSP